MPVDDIKVLLFSLFFGAVMGWGFSREPDDVQGPGRVAMVIALAIGAVTWGFSLAGGDAEDGLVGLAAVSLTAGTAAGLISLRLFRSKA